MRILALSFYYEPDLCAGSFRATALVEALRKRAPPGMHIDVVTTIPNRYRSFSQRADETEASAGLEIRRIELPTHSSDILGQSRAFVRFARNVLEHVADRKYDLVFATSSRLMTAALGAWIARRKRSLLYLDIRDIFVDTIKDVLPTPVALVARHGFSLIESWTMRRADRINIVSPAFESYFRARFGDCSLARFTNGIDNDFLDFASRSVTGGGTETPPIVLYAGNIGAGQDLHEVLPGLATALHDRARFIVIGDGGRRRALEHAVAGVENVEVRAPMSRTDLMTAYSAADILFLHLGAGQAFEKVLPSKLFEYAALGKPILAGVAGYAARFVQEEISNAAVFSPCDVHAAVKAFDSLKIRSEPRPEFVAKYARENIVRAMADDILAIMSRRVPP